jgi:hypothetical protein
LKSNVAEIDHILTVVSAEQVARNLHERVNVAYPIRRATKAVLHVRAEQATRKVFLMRLKLGNGLEPRQPRALVVDPPDVTLSLRDDQKGIKMYSQTAL